MALGVSIILNYMISNILINPISILSILLLIFLQCSNMICTEGGNVIRVIRKKKRKVS